MFDNNKAFIFQVVPENILSQKYNIFYTNEFGRHIDMLCILVYNKIEMQSQERESQPVESKLKKL